MNLRLPGGFYKFVAQQNLVSSSRQIPRYYQTTIGVMASQLMCCGIKFGWFDELVAHCQDVHAVQSTPARQPAASAPSSPQSDLEDLSESDSNEGRYEIDDDDEEDEDEDDDEDNDEDDESDFEVKLRRIKRDTPVKVSYNYYS